MRERVRSNEKEFLTLATKLFDFNFHIYLYHKKRKKENDWNFWLWKSDFSNQITHISAAEDIRRRKRTTRKLEINFIHYDIHIHTMTFECTKSFFLASSFVLK